MTVFVDTGVIYADYDEGASRHESANQALNAAYRGKLGQPFTSDYVYDEGVTLTQRRTGTFEAAKTIGEKVRGVGEFADVYSLVHVAPANFQAAIDAFERYDDQGLSFTDATTVALVEHRDIDTVLSFDDDFDGIVDRTDPADVAEHNA
jgi:predicted nucleic acid-binding protein